jgi:hypothetical protein
MVLVQDDESKKIYEVDGKQVMHDLITGELWFSQTPS